MCADLKMMQKQSLQKQLVIKDGYQDIISDINLILHITLSSEAAACIKTSKLNHCGADGCERDMDGDVRKTQVIDAQCTIKAIISIIKHE